MSQAELATWYLAQLGEVRDLEGFRHAALRFDADAFVSAEERARYLALPGAVEVHGRVVPMHYEVEEAADGSVAGVVRLQLPEKVARTMVEEELPVLDRPVRFTVARGARGAVRADSLAELREELSRPWSAEEVSRAGRRGGREGDRSRGKGGRPGRGKKEKRRKRGR